MNELLLDRILEHCQRLGLLHLRTTLSETLARAEAEDWGRSALLDHLLETELAAREERRIRNSLKLAGFPFLKTLDAFDFAFQPSLERSRVMELATLNFLQRRASQAGVGCVGVAPRWRSRTRPARASRGRVKRFAANSTRRVMSGKERSSGRVMMTRSGRARLARIRQVVEHLRPDEAFFWSDELDLPLLPRRSVDAQGYTA